MTQTHCLRRSWLRSLFLLLCGGLLLATPATLFAQDAEEETEDSDVLVTKPIGIVNIASSEAFFATVDSLFEQIDRIEIADFFALFVADRTNDLAGLDDERPISVVVTLREALPPTPEVIVYVPITDVDDFIETLEQLPGANFSIDEVESGSGLYELRGRRQTFYMQAGEKYAYIGQNQDVIESELPDLTGLQESLASKYNLAAHVTLSHIPANIRDVFISLLRAGTEGQLQQRDGESDAAYRMRRAQGQNQMDGIEQLLKEGDTLTMGLRPLQEGVAVVEVDITAVANSDFSKALKAFPPRPSRFQDLFDAQALLSASFSLMMEQQDTKPLEELVSVITDEVKLRNEDRVPPAIEKVIKGLKATIEKRHLDGFFQFDGDGEPGTYGVIGALRIESADEMAPGLIELMKLVEEEAVANSSDPANVPVITYGDETLQGVSFHRIKGPGNDGVEVFGDAPALYVGVGAGALWICLGSDAALNQMEAAIETSLQPQTLRDRTANKPLQFVTHLNRWFSMPAARFPNRMKEVAEEVLTGENDAIRMQLQPTENGAKFELSIPSGLTRMMATGIAGRFDRGGRRRGNN